MTSKERSCACETGKLGATLITDVDAGKMILDKEGTYIDEVAYIRGLRDHPDKDSSEVQTLLHHVEKAGILMSPGTSTDEEEAIEYRVLETEEGEKERDGLLEEEGERRQIEEEEEGDTQLAQGAVEWALGAEGESEGSETEEEKRKRKEKEEKRKRLKGKKKSSTTYGWLEEPTQCEHPEEPPMENPDQGHPEGEASPRAEAPSTEDTEPWTSPMHTRAGTYMNKPAKKKGRKDQ